MVRFVLSATLVQICFLLTVRWIRISMTSSLTPYDGEMPMTPKECKLARGIFLLDTCLINQGAQQAKKGSWASANKYCRGISARLMQLPTSAFDTALFNISGWTKLWMGLRREAIGESTFWVHGEGERSAANWSSENIVVNDDNRTYPHCGLVVRMPKQGENAWMEVPCNSESQPYWCQIIIDTTAKTTIKAIQSTPGQSRTSMDGPGRSSPSRSTPAPRQTEVQSRSSTGKSSSPSTKMVQSEATANRHSRDPCQDARCVFGHCSSNSTNGTYRCECTSGFSGVNCQIASGWSSDPIHVYNYVIQDLGNAWVIGTSASTLLIYTVLNDHTPEGTLKRHSLLALILEHTFILLFRSPAITGLSHVACRAMSLVMYYIRTTHASLMLFHGFHVYYIMTGVTRGEWGWNGRSFPFLFLAWILFPGVSCCTTFLSDPDLFGTEFTCMVNWEPGHLSQFFALFAHLLLALLSVESLEEAHMYRRWQKKYVGEANVNPLHLQVADVGRLGTILVALLAPLGFYMSSFAIYTANPIAFTIAFNTNVMLGVTILTTYVVSNTVVWASVKKAWVRVRGLMTNRGGQGAVY